MKLGKRVGSLLLTLAIIMALVVTPSFKSNAYVSSPNNLAQTNASGNNISIQWDAVSGATLYTVSVKLGGYYGQLISSQPVTTNSATITVPYRGARYAVEVTATTAEGTSSAASRLVYSIPLTPGNIYVSSWRPKTNKPYLEWAGYSEDGYIPSGYEVKITTLAGKKVKTYKTSSRYLYKGISKIKNAGFKVQIRSCYTISTPSGNKNLWSDWSKVKAFVPQPDPSSRRYIGSSTTTLKWSKIKNAKSYTIYKVTGSYPNYKFKKYKKVSGSTTSTTVPHSLGRVTIIPEVKVKGKKYKWNRKDFGTFYGVSV